MRYNVPKHIKQASELLLRTLIERLGKSTEVGNKAGFTRQAIYNFEILGYVPLVQVYSLAKALRIGVYAFSYYKLMEVFGDQTPSFENIVKNLTVLTKEDEEKILKIYKKR